MARSSWFSLKRFAVALLAVGVGATLGLEFVPMVGLYVGTLLGGFAAGLAFEQRPLVESGLAGLFAGMGVLLASKLIGGDIVDALIGLITLQPQLLVLSAALSLTTGVLGAHFGNDLRDGLTRPINESGSTSTAPRRLDLGPSTDPVPSDGPTDVDGSSGSTAPSDSGIVPDSSDSVGSTDSSDSDEQ